MSAKQNMSLVRIPDLIEKKRDGKKLKTTEIQHLIDELLASGVTDGQLGAFLMAIFIQVDLFHYLFATSFPQFIFLLSREWM